MNHGIYSGIAAMRSAEKQVEAITTNLANVSTASFKRLGTATHSFEAVLRGRRVPQITTRTQLDLSQGPLRETGNTYDMAIDGNAYFAVEGPQGEIYTRRGQFRVDEEGALQTLDGLPVIWQGPQRVIDFTGVEPTVDMAGTVRQGEVELGRLRLVAFDSPERLTPDRLGYWHAPVGLTEAPVDATVHQHQLEMSNADPLDELVALITAQRRFESAARLVNMIQSSYSRLNAPS